ncbi:MAG: hypothetical protein RLZZ387_5177 [Chloroflexota bacterium]|jgi:glycosyltransferase involved in cell wall biosynthesis
MSTLTERVSRLLPGLAPAVELLLKRGLTTLLWATWRSGLPTVLTPVGARGLPLEDGVHGIIAAPEQIPGRLRELLADSDTCERLGAAGRALTEAHFDWHIVADTVADAYERLLQERGR